MLTRGGAEVHTPHPRASNREVDDPSERETIAFTLLQLDGDIVTRLKAEIDGASIRRHFAEVHRRQQAVAAALRRVVGVFSACGGVAALLAVRPFTDDVYVVLAASGFGATLAYCGRRIIVGWSLRAAVRLYT